MTLPRLHVVTLGVLAFLVLSLRFSPNWVAFGTAVREAEADVGNAEAQLSLENAFFSGYSERGFYVLRQARDLSTQIDDPNHKIVRWRLLIPAIGHALSLPRAAVLGLAHLGCLALILALFAIGHSRTGSANEGFWLAMVAGSSAPFFASMGLLGYYDSWVALALLGVAFARSRTLVVLACLLAPWIDERFVLGLPLALLVRWLANAAETQPWRQWLKDEAAVPVALTAVYTLIRLHLGGTESSQTVQDYLHTFVFPASISFTERLFGAWAGIRLGALLIAAAVLGVWLTPGRFRRSTALFLAASIGVTAGVGVLTALDISRSMLLVIPVVPLGWVLASRLAWWRRFHAGIGLGVLALALPAHHVFGKLTERVDNIWRPSLALSSLENNVGAHFANGTGIRRDPVAAFKWCRRAALAGNASAAANVGLAYLVGRGVPADPTEAVRWFQQSAHDGDAIGQANLGQCYATGNGIPRDVTLAVAWYVKAMVQGNAAAANNLGLLYASGDGLPKNLPEAVRCFRFAADRQ